MDDDCPAECAQYGQTGWGPRSRCSFPAGHSGPHADGYGFLWSSEALPEAVPTATATSGRYER